MGLAKAACLGEIIVLLCLRSAIRSETVSISSPGVLAMDDHQCEAVDVDTEQVTKARLDSLGGSLFGALDAETAAVAAELVLERDDWVFGQLSRLSSLAGALPRLVPPPLVDLLLAHVEVLVMSGTQSFYAVAGPHGALS